MNAIQILMLACSVALLYVIWRVDSTLDDEVALFRWTRRRK